MEFRLNERRQHARGLAAALAFVFLAGCSNVEDLFVAPGKFTIYNCDQLATRGRIAATRERELKGLMSKASGGTGGAVVNALAYRNEYLATQGELKQLEEVAIEKKCDMPWRSISDRSMW